MAHDRPLSHWVLGVAAAALGGAWWWWWWRARQRAAESAATARLLAQLRADAGNVSVADTSRLVAAYRAAESAGPSPLFRDPFAAALAGERGQLLARLSLLAGHSASGVVARTAALDEHILRCVAGLADGDVDLVVNLAAGLDARPWRLPLPRGLRWVDVDVPEIVAYKGAVMGAAVPACQYEACAADLSDARARGELLDRVGVGARRALVITEGVLNYLQEEDVRGLAAELHARHAFQIWLLDVAGAARVKALNAFWTSSIQSGHRPYSYGPANAVEFFAQLGWRAVAVESSAEVMDRLGHTGVVERIKHWLRGPTPRGNYDFLLLERI